MDYKRIIQKERVKFFEVADNVFAGMSPYKGISWANAGFIARGKGMVYDTFFDLFHAREMQECYHEVTNGRNPAFVVSSHYNADHTFGNKVFENSAIIMHREARREHLSENIQWTDGLIRRGKDCPESTAGERYLAAEWEGFDMTGVEWIEPDIEIDSDLTIDLDGTRVEILSVAPAHSDSDLLAWMPKERVIFTGDIVHIGCGAYSESGVRNWCAVLDRIIALEPAVVVPGHGALCGIETVMEQKDYLMNILAQFDKYYTDDITTLELCKKADVSKFLHWIQPERIYMSIDSLIKGRRGIPPKPDWEKMPAEQRILRDYQKEKYGDRYQTWDPYVTWRE